MGSKNNKSTQTSSQTTKADPRAEAVYMDLLERLKTVGQDTYTPYGGERVAGFTPEQQALLAQMTQPGGAGAGAFGQALDLATKAAGPVTTEDINRFMDPYVSNVVDSALARERQQSAMDISDLKGQAITAGAFGGDRARIAEVAMRQNQADQRNQLVSDLMSKGYSQAAANALAEKGYQTQGVGNLVNVGQAQGAGFKDAYSAAQQQQQLNQAQMNVPYEDFLEGRAFPYQQLQYLSGIGTGLGSQLGSTSSGKSVTTTPGPSPLSQILGAGLSLAALPVGGPVAGAAAGSLGGNFLSSLSDERMKENIEPIGSTDDGQTIYKYNYKGDPRTQIGLLAQEVEQVHPEAVGSVDGFKTVNYDLATGRAEGGSVLGDAIEMAEKIKEKREPDWKYHYPYKPSELRAYNPSTRDQMGAELMKGGKSSPEYRRLIEGLIGSTGLGETGPALIDLIPGFSAANNAVDAYYDATERGDYLGALQDLAEGAAPAGMGRLGDLLDKLGIKKRISESYSPQFIEELDSRVPGIFRKPAEPYGKGTYTQRHRDLTGDEFIDAMTDPNRSFTPKGFTKHMSAKNAEENLVDPLDLETRIRNTLNDLPKTVRTDPDWRKFNPSNKKDVRRILEMLRETDKDRYISAVPGIPLALEAFEDEGKAEGGAVEGTNWLGLDPAMSRALMTAGMAMMAGQSPFFASNVGAGGLAGIQAYQDYLSNEERTKRQSEADTFAREQAELKNTRALEELELRRKEMERKPATEFEAVKDMTTEEGAPVVFNKNTGRYQNAVTGEVVDGRVIPTKKKYTDLPVGVQKEVVEARDVIQSSSNSISNLTQAAKINEQAYSGIAAGTRGWAKSLIEGKKGGPGTATENLDNIITGGALESLKATFGAAPTEGERAILLELQGSVSKAPKVREDIFKRAIAGALARQEYNKKKAAAMIDGSYFTEEFPSEPDPYEAYMPTAESIINAAKKPTQEGNPVGTEKTFRGSDGQPVTGVWDGKEWVPKQ